MTSVLIFLSGFDPGTYYIEDNDDPTDGIVQLRGPDGNVIPFNIPTEFLNVIASAGRNVIINLPEWNPAADINIGSLTDPLQNPDSITVANIRGAADVMLAANGTITEAGSDAGADIVANSVILSAGAGIGTGDNALETQVAAIEAETTTGGMNIANFGSVTIGGLTADVAGLDVETSGNLIFVNQGTISLADETDFETVHGGNTSGNVMLVANGYNSDIIATVDQDSVAAPGGSVVLTAGRDVSLGTAGLNFDNDVRASGGLTVSAGRDVNIDGFADLASDGYGAGTGGNLVVNAGRDINVLNATGTDGSMGSEGSAGASTTLNAGPGGFVRLLATSSATLFSSSGSVTVNADRLVINATAGISANNGGVILRPKTEGWAVDVGSGTDGAFALELSDAELDRVFANNLTIGSDNAGGLQVTAAISLATTPSAEFRTGENLTVLAGITVTNALGLIAGDNVIQQTGTISAQSVTIQVDNLGDDGGVGGMGRLGAISPSGTPNALSVVLNGNGDADILRGAEGIDQTVHGNGGNDIITSSGEGRYFGDNGNDTIFAGLSSGLVPEVLDGGAGVDTLDTTSFVGNYTINLATGTSNFSFESFLNFENVTTGSGNDTITGTAAANVILTGQGNDTLNGGGGADAMAGGQGDDTYYVDSFFDSVIEAIGEGNDTLITSASFALGSGQEVELMRTPGSATTSSINLTGNAFVQMLLGNAGANVLNGGGGADTLRGYGGDDTYWIDNAGEVLIEAAGQGTDTAITSVSYALAAGVSVEVLRTLGSGTTDVIDLTGNAFVQMLLGNAAANVLDGGGGADTLRGYGGNDTYRIDNAGDVLIEAVGQGTDTAITTVSYTLAAGVSVEVLRTTGSSGTGAIDLTGNEQNQTLAGNAAANVLRGGDGNDVLWGYLGNDELTGGAGSDTMVFSTALGPGNVDLIHGYVVADDSIMIDNAVFTGLAEGALAAGAFRVGAAAVDADDRILYNSVTGELLFDVDGVGGAAAVVFADMSAGLAMTASEFFVI